MTDQASALRHLLWERGRRGDKGVGKRPSPYTVAIASGKGGVGKTTVAVNLSLALGERGHRVFLWDADMSLANINLLLNFFPKRTVQEALSGDVSLEEVLVDVGDNVTLLPGACGEASLARLDDLTLSSLHRRLMTLVASFDFLIVDAPAGIGTNVLSLLDDADLLLLVTVPEPTALTDAYGLLKALSRRGFQGQMYLVLNMADGDLGIGTGERFCRVVRNFLGFPIRPVAVIPESPWVIESVRRQTPLIKLAPHSPPAKAFRSLAHLLAERGEKDHANP